MEAFLWLMVVFAVTFVASGWAARADQRAWRRRQAMRRAAEGSGLRPTDGRHVSGGSRHVEPIDYVM